MKFLKFLLFAFLAIFAVNFGLSALELEPDFFSRVFYPFGLNGTLFAMSIPLVDLYGVRIS